MLVKYFDGFGNENTIKAKSIFFDAGKNGDKVEVTNEEGRVIYLDYDLVLEEIKEEK